MSHWTEVLATGLTMLGGMLRGAAPNAPAQAATPENPTFDINSAAAWDALGVEPSSSGIRVTTDKALTLPAYWRGVNLIAGTIAKVPLLTYERVGEGKRRAIEHHAYYLQRYSPTPARIEQTAYDWKRTKMGHVLTHGNGYSFIDRDGDGKPTELILLDPDVTWPVREDGQLLYATQVDGEWRRLLAANVLHWRGLGWDGLIGYDVISYMAEALGEGLAKQKHSSVYFRNSAKPSVVIEVPGEMKPEAAKKLISDWNRMQGGLDNAHKAALLDRGAKVNPFSADAAASQLIESRKFSLLDISNITGLPPHKFGDAATRGYASLEEENQSCIDDCYDHWFNMIEAEHREKLLSEDEKRSDTHAIEFLRQALVRGNYTARGNFFRAALGGRAWMNVNEVRGLENLNPDDGADSDKILTPLNLGKGGIDNAPADPNDPQPGHPNNAELRAAIAGTLTDACRRSVTRIGLHARRTAKDGKKYEAWLEAFQADHQAAVAEILGPAVAAANALTGGGRAATAEAEWLLALLHKPLAKLAETCTPRELAAAVEKAMTDFETSIPTAYARELLGEQ